jgi:hypothetical protein
VPKHGLSALSGLRTAGAPVMAIAGSQERVVEGLGREAAVRGCTA